MYLKRRVTALLIGLVCLVGLLPARAQTQAPAAAPAAPAAVTPATPVKLDPAALTAKIDEYLQASTTHNSVVFSAQ